MAPDRPFTEPSIAQDENPAMPAPPEDLVDLVSPIESNPYRAAPRKLVELKTAIDKRLRDLITQRRTRAGSVEEFGGLAIIRGVGLGMGTPSSGGYPGTPSLTIFVSEPITAEQVRSLIADTTGIQIPQNIGLNIEHTGLIEPQAQAGQSA